MRYRPGRTTWKLGPLRFNFSIYGLVPRFTSWGFKVGRFGHNVTRKTTSIDTPGPGGLYHRHGRRRR